MGRRRSPDPEPGEIPADPEERAAHLIRVWQRIEPLLRRVLRIRRWLLSVESVIAIGLITAVAVLALAVTSNGSAARHLQAVTRCQDDYTRLLVTVLRDRSAASAKAMAALETLISSTVHITSPAQYAAEVSRYRAAVRAAQRDPVPPLPPAACR